MSADHTPIIPNPPTPEWLTEVLHRSGLLTSGSVVRAEESANAAFNSAARHLHITYSSDVPPDLPQWLFFKRNLPEAWAQRAGAREVAFYQVAATMADRLPMVVPCYGAAYDATSGDSWLLLQDVSATHVAPVTREQSINGAGVPTDAQLTAIVEALAGLHAAWWEHPALGRESLVVSEWYRDRECFEMTVRQFRDNWNAFQSMAGPTLPAPITTLYESVLAELPHIWEPVLAERMARLRQLTISHGDCYLSQFLCPLPDAPNGTAYLIDFQGACGDLPAMDLTFLFATFWSPEQRHTAQREHRLLRLYLDTLHRHGIASYTWDDLVADYRISLAFMIFYPVWDAVNGSSRDYWEPKLRCLASAAEDWECRDLLASLKKQP
ncbi:MAG: phosphotransferase [Nitrososphaerota archaeon]